MKTDTTTAEPVGMEPCAHCGGTAEKIPGPSGTHYIECRACSVGTKYESDPEDVWNRRTPSAHERALREALREAWQRLPHDDECTNTPCRCLLSRIDSLLSTKTERT